MLLAQKQFSKEALEDISHRLRTRARQMPCPAEACGRAEGCFAHNGFGIGLGFAKKVITAQAGSLRVMNCSPHGAVFEIRFFETVLRWMRCASCEI